MPEVIPGQVIRREGRIDDYESDDDRDSLGRRESGGSSYRTVQRYHVTPSRVEPIEDERTSDRFDGPSRPRSATELRPRSTIVEQYVEREPYSREYGREHSERTRTVVYERDREGHLDQPWERESSSRDVRGTDVRIEKRERRNEPYELERYQRETEYYDRPEPPQPIIIRQQPLEQKSTLRGLPQPQLEEDRQVVGREPRGEDEYYYKKRVKESRGLRQSDDEDVETSPMVGPLTIAAYHERGDNRGGRIVRRLDSFGQSHYMNEDYSDGSDVVVRRKIIKESNRRRIPYHEQYLAEGALAGAGVATLLANHRQVGGKEPRQPVAGGAALGATGAEVVTRARSRYREYHAQDESRSRSSSEHSHRKIRTGLSLAAAAKYVSNRKARLEEARGRSGSRSISRRRYSDDDDFHSRSRSRRADPKRRASDIVKAGVATAAVAGFVQHFRNKSKVRERSTSGMRSRVGSEVDPELGMIHNGTELVYTNRNYYYEAATAAAGAGAGYGAMREHCSRSGRRHRHSSYSSPERDSRSLRSRIHDVAGSGGGTAAAAIDIKQYKEIKERKEMESEKERRNGIIRQDLVLHLLSHLLMLPYSLSRPP